MLRLAIRGIQCLQGPIHLRPTRLPRYGFRLSESDIQYRHGNVHNVHRDNVTGSSHGYGVRWVSQGMTGVDLVC